MFNTKYDTFIFKIPKSKIKKIYIFINELIFLVYPQFMNECQWKSTIQKKLK